MSSFEPRPRVAVIGGQGIGRFHAGLYGRLGAEVVAVCCSTPESASRCAVELKEAFGLAVAPYHRMEDVLALDIQGVSLCAPPGLHYEQILACLDRGLAVFCEKPLFWNEGETLEEVARKLDILRNHPGRRLFVNTSNTSFLDTAVERMNGVVPAELAFSFYTQGPYVGDGIALDLFPHALSFVLELFGRREFADFSVQADAHRYLCSFAYGDARISLDLREDPEGPKDLFFSLDGRRFRRVQEGFGPTYRVYLEDELAGERLEADDPFKVFLADFLAYICAGAPAGKDRFDLDAANLELMATLLLQPSI